MLVLRVSERVKYAMYPEDMKPDEDFRIGVVTRVRQWKGSKKGADIFVRYGPDSVGQFRTDNDRDVLCRFLEVGETVGFQEEKTDAEPRLGVVIKAAPWEGVDRVGFDYTVRFEDDGSEGLFTTGNNVHLLHSRPLIMDA